MNPAVAAGVLAGVLMAASQSAPQAASPPPSAAAERVESGTVESPEGIPIHYRIRLLPVSSFPALPEDVGAWLNRRGCMIPQTYEARQPENVIHGAFHGRGASDWAALCSVDGTTTLYVFPDGQRDDPTALRSQPDAAWLGADPGETVRGSAWGIAVRSAGQLRSLPEFRRLLPVDHDGIDDARLERALTIHYEQAGQWLTVTTGNDN
jgi:hypothetical protein